MLCIPELKRAIIRNCDKLFLVKLQHLIDSRGVLFYALYWLELDSVISMSNSLFFLFNLVVCFTDELQ